MLVDGVAGERPGRIGGRRQHVLQARYLHDIGRVAAARAFGVEGVDGAALERLDGVLDEAAFVQRVGVDHHLHVVVVGDRQAVVDRGWRGAPVLVQLERAGAALDHFLQRRGQRGVALAREAKIDRKRIRGLDHAREVPRPRRAGGGERAMRRTGTAAEQRGHARHQRIIDLLRTDEMNMRVEATGRENFPFARDDLGARPDDDGDARLNVRIAGLADRGDAALLQADVGLHDAPVIEDQRVGDDCVGRAFLIGDLALAHPIADHLAAAEFYLLAVGGEILFDLDDEIGVGQPHPVAGGRPKHVCINRALYFDGHDFSRDISDGYGTNPQNYQHTRANRFDSRFNLLRFAAALSSFPDAHVRFAECEGRQDQTGPGAEAATSVAPCDRFDLGFQLRVAALET